MSEFVRTDDNISKKQRLLKLQKQKLQKQQQQLKLIEEEPLNKDKTDKDKNKDKNKDKDIGKDRNLGPLKPLRPLKPLKTLRPLLPYCSTGSCQCRPGFRAVNCGCRQCNSGSATADPVTIMENTFDNMMDPFSKIYPCVNFVCKGRNFNYPYSSKCCYTPNRCRPFATVCGKGIIDNNRGCSKCSQRNCDNDNSLNIFDLGSNNFDNQFNFNNNSLGRPRCANTANPLLPFYGLAIPPRCQPGANTNALNTFEREANRFDNRFEFGNYDYREA